MADLGKGRPGWAGMPGQVMVRLARWRQVVGRSLFGRRGSARDGIGLTVMARQAWRSWLAAFRRGKSRLGRLVLLRSERTWLGRAGTSRLACWVQAGIARQACLGERGVTGHSGYHQARFRITRQVGTWQAGHYMAIDARQGKSGPGRQGVVRSGAVKRCTAGAAGHLGARHGTGGRRGWALSVQAPHGRVRQAGLGYVRRNWV